MGRARSFSAFLPGSLFVLALLTGQTIRSSASNVDSSISSSSSEEPWAGRVGPWEETSELELKVEKPESRSGLLLSGVEPNQGSAQSSSQVEEVLNADPDSASKLLMMADHGVELSNAIEEVNAIIRANYMKAHSTADLQKRDGKVGRRFWPLIAGSAITALPHLISAIDNAISRDRSPAPAPAPAPAPVPVPVPVPMPMPVPQILPNQASAGPQVNSYPPPPSMDVNSNCEQVFICRPSIIKPRATSVKSRSGVQKLAYRGLPGEELWYQDSKDLAKRNQKKSDAGKGSRLSLAESESEPDSLLLDKAEGNFGNELPLLARSQSGSSTRSGSSKRFRPIEYSTYDYEMGSRNSMDVNSLRHKSKIARGMLSQLPYIFRQPLDGRPDRYDEF